MNFIRKYRILISDGIESFDVSDLRCVFHIEKQWAEQPNMSYCIIYNLSAETESKIIQNGQVLSIEAGYENGDYGQIFQGNIIYCARGKDDNVTFQVKILSLDGDNFFNFGTVAFTLNKGIGLREQATAISQNSSIPATLSDISALDESSKLSRGKVFFGSAKDQMKNIAKTTNGVFNIDNGSINIQKVASIPEGEAAVLNSETGLIGFPEQTDLGVTCTCLINPRVIIGGMIKLDTRSINQADVQIGQFLRALPSDGLFRTIKLVIDGDTRGNEWYMRIEGIAQGESLIPGLMPTSDSSGY